MKKTGKYDRKDMKFFQGYADRRMMKLKYKFDIEKIQNKITCDDKEYSKIDYDIKNNGEVHFIHTYIDSD